ncbi:MAG TPA: S8 family serine peptidase, partial [Ilumatobacteraceae bacterium]|nr:S8 family serine peptidase [Ilumatobacteraceae bacterium]
GRMNEFAAARALAAVQKPTALLVVESHDAAGKPSTFSQLGGDISAPGEAIASTVPTSNYALMQGTSMAAPFVTGALGYLFTVKPGTDWRTYLDAVVNGSRQAMSGGANHLDVFGALVKLGTLKSTVDVNDWSADGNRRIYYGDNGQALAADTVGTTATDTWDTQLGKRTSAPDGRIDMRDLRRFRDAWLQTCVELTDGSPNSNAPACPPQITLDGDFDHPKKDGNGDRCVYLPTAPCESKEGWYSRFDFNGDGRLDLYADAPVYIGNTGTPGTSPNIMTDLDVFRTFFDSNIANTEGWTKNDLPALLVSADIDLRLGDFWAAGANNVSVTTLVDGVATGPARTFAKPATGPGGGMITLPVDEWGSKVELVASATGPDGNPLTAVPFVVPVLLAGDDKVASPCVARLDLTFDTQALLPGQETDVKATVHDCNPASTRPEVENRIVTFGVLAEGNEVPVILGVPGAIMDAKGTAEATLRAGTGTGTFTVWAKLELPGGRIVRGEADVTVTPQIKLAYHWRATLDSLDVAGSTRWNGMPDCSSTGQDYCIDHAHQYVDPADPTITFDRQGTITATTAGVRLTEEVGGGGGYVTTDFTWTDLATGVVRDDGIKLFGFNIINSERNRYANHPVPVEMTPVDGEVLVSNLRSLALLGYRSDAWAGGYGID